MNMKRRRGSPIPNSHSKCTRSNLFQRNKNPLQEGKLQDDTKLKKKLILENESDEFSLSSEESDSKKEDDSERWNTIQETEIVGRDEARDSDTEEWESPEKMRFADSVCEREIPVHLRANRKGFTGDLELDCPGLTSTQVEECHHSGKSTAEVKRFDFGNLSPILERKGSKQLLASAKTFHTQAISPKERVGSRQSRAGAETFHIENISPIGASKYGRSFLTSSQIQNASKIKRKVLTSSQIEKRRKNYSQAVGSTTQNSPNISQSERRKNYSHTVGSETYNCRNISQSESPTRKRINFTSNAGHSKVSSKDSPEDSESESETLNSNQFENTEDYFHPVPLPYSSDENNVTKNVDTEDFFRHVPLHDSSDENNVTENVVEIHPEELDEIPGVFPVNTEDQESISVSKDTRGFSERRKRSQAVVQSSSKVGGQQNSEEILQLNSNDYDTSLSSTRSNKESSRKNLYKKYEEMLKNIPICPLSITKTPFHEMKFQQEKNKRRNVKTILPEELNENNGVLPESIKKKENIAKSRKTKLRKRRVVQSSSLEELDEDNGVLPESIKKQENISKTRTKPGIRRVLHFSSIGRQQNTEETRQLISLRCDSEVQQSLSTSEKKKKEAF